MNKERYTQILTSVFLAIVLLTIGFYFGKKGSVTPDSRADLEPFWKAWDLLDKNFVGASSTTPKIDSQAKVWGAVQGLASSYGDPYTVFFPPVESKNFEEEISGAFGGVGMEIDTVDNVLTVVAPLKGTPAESAGVLAGDKIIMIGDKSALNMPIEDAIKLIKGEVGTSVVITFARKGEKNPVVKTLVRALINIPTVDTKILPDNVFVISLYSFSATSPNLFRGALREFIESGSDKLILDLRNNPGGYLEASLDMASWFLPTGKVVVTENFGDKKEKNEYRSKGYNIFTDKLKFVILVNEGSASASEILAGALREYNKAILVGEKTFGKGSVQELVPVTSDTSLKITVAHWFTPLGKSISNGGLTPDIEVKLTAENTKGGNDPQMNAAVKYLTK
ncbi:MAG: S41 family peptidase [Candidatus Paceibacterota bacterium]|jgi:carboxyl-terminal processing protease